MTKTTKKRVQRRGKLDAQYPKGVSIITRRPSVKEIEMRDDRIRAAGSYVLGAAALYALMWLTAYAG